MAAITPTENETSPLARVFQLAGGAALVGAALPGMTALACGAATAASAGLFAVSYSQVIKVGLDKEPAQQQQWSQRYLWSQYGALGFGAAAAVATVLGLGVALAGVGALVAGRFLL